MTGVQTCALPICFPRGKRQVCSPERKGPERGGRLGPGARTPVLHVLRSRLLQGPWAPRLPHPGREEAPCAQCTHFTYERLRPGEPQSSVVRHRAANQVGETRRAAGSPPTHSEPCHPGCAPTRARLPGAGVAFVSLPGVFPSTGPHFADWSVADHSPSLQNGGVEGNVGEPAGGPTDAPFYGARRLSG